MSAAPYSYDTATPRALLIADQLHGRSVRIRSALSTRFTTTTAKADAKRLAAELRDLASELEAEL